MSTSLQDCPQKIPFKYSCKICNYYTCNKKDYTKHINTNKHIINENQQQSTLLSLPTSQYTCNCGKQYKERSGLWRHKKICSIIKTSEDIKETTSEDSKETTEEPKETTEPTIGLNEIIDANLVIQLLKQNMELQKSLIELSKEKNNNHSHNNHSYNNNNNKTFNLQFYLNETCKDALNMSEFVDSIKMQLSDLEDTGNLGYIEGVTRIINKNLNALETCKRPIHCSDLKRETIYIKDENEWIKENDDKTKLRHAIKQIANKNIQQITEWRRLNPDCSEYNSKKNDLYLKIVSNAMSGSTKEEQISNINKIISNVTKSVVIDKGKL